LSHSVTYLDIEYMCGGVAHSTCIALGWPEMCHQDCLMSTA